jgi:hypothetical protein
LFTYCKELDDKIIEGSRDPMEEFNDEPIRIAETVKLFEYVKREENPTVH